MSEMKTLSLSEAKRAIQCPTKPEPNLSQKASSGGLSEASRHSKNATF